MSPNLAFCCDLLHHQSPYPQPCHQKPKYPLCPPICLGQFFDRNSGRKKALRKITHTSVYSLTASTPSAFMYLKSLISSSAKLSQVKVFIGLVKPRDPRTRSFPVAYHRSRISFASSIISLIDSSSAFPSMASGLNILL
jgi:hypothetical protein